MPQREEETTARLVWFMTLNHWLRLSKNLILSSFIYKKWMPITFMQAFFGFHGNSILYSLPIPNAGQSWPWFIHWFSTVVTTHMLRVNRLYQSDNVRATSYSYLQNPSPLWPVRPVNSARRITCCIAWNSQQILRREHDGLTIPVGCEWEPRSEWNGFEKWIF